MYKSYTPDDYRKAFNLPENYQVDSMILYGNFRPQQYNEIFKEELIANNQPVNVRSLDDYLDHIYEYKIADKNLWFACAMGPVRVSDYTYLASIFGSRMNIHLGSCGGLTPEGDCADIIVPTFSFDTGSSVKMYTRNDDPKVYSNQQLADKLIQKLNQQDKKVLCGPIMTCHALMAESKEDVTIWSREGYYGVEMETSSMFVTSNAMKVPSASMVYISDNLIKEESFFTEHRATQKELRDKTKHLLCHIAQEIVLNQ